LRTAIKNEDYEQALSLATSSNKKNENSIFLMDLFNFTQPFFFVFFVHFISTVTKLLPDDTDVIKCKCVSLIHLGKFDEVLNDKSTNIRECEFERAYCLYQLSRLPEALKIIRNSIKENGSVKGQEDSIANMKCLEAQVLYKLSTFTEAAEVYQFLIDKDYKELEGSEILSNGLAAYANSYKGHGIEGINKLKSSRQLAELVDVNDMDFDDPDKSCELAYNTACAYINGGQYEQALKLLELSEKRFKEHAKSMEDEVDESGGGGGANKPIMPEEEAAISSQMGYVLLKTSPPGSLGAARAMSYCMKVLKATEHTESAANVKASVAKAVCVNNLAVIRRDKELPDSLKRLKHAATGIESKLTPEQLFSTKFNYCLILLHMNKVNG
jgi:tetratricopeptide (TPR) repeat protein